MCCPSGPVMPSPVTAANIAAAPRQRRSFWLTSSDICPSLLQSHPSPLDELLAAVDVVGGAGNRRVRHEVNGQCGDVLRADDASDRQRRAELLAARVQLVAEERRRERSVDESGGDQVDPDGRELDGQIGYECGTRGRESRD